MSHYQAFAYFHIGKVSISRAWNVLGQGVQGTCLNIYGAQIFYDGIPEIDALAPAVSLFVLNKISISDPPRLEFHPPKSKLSNIRKL